jgi:serine/threonine protein kinase
MNPSHDQWHQLEELFNAARELPAKGRESLLRARTLDSEIRREINDLLQAHDALEVSGEEGFLKSLAVVHASALLQQLVDPEASQRDDGIDPIDRDGSRSEESRDPLGISGKTISHFHVKSYLAAGGMGVLYIAEDLQLGRTVALKFPLPHQQLDQAVKERFFREARSTAVLDHPNLCTVHEVGESPQGVFMAMPLYKGETLKDRLERERTLPLAEAVRITRELATGLASAHAAGIIHRDIKPGNVMLLPDGAVKILDFGIAKALDATLTKSQATLGTIAYMAPEQIRNAAVDGRTDLWAVGVMLYRMLTGVLPFPGETEVAMLHSILHEDPRRVSTIDPSARRVLDTVVAGLLQKKPADRYASAEALLADLHAMDSGKAPVHRIPLWKRVPRKKRVPFLVVAVGILLAIGVLSWLKYRPPAVAVNAATTPALKFVNNTAVIRTSAELLAALSPANAGKRIHLRAGTYDVDRPLTVPDGMVLEGAGVMRFDDDRHPVGFVEDTRTILKMTSDEGGDMLTLGDGVNVQRVEIVDRIGRSGNVVAVLSRRPADSVRVTIAESVIVNPNPFTIAVGGAVSGGLAVTTRNRNMGSDPPPDEGSALSVRLIRSVIRSPSGGGGFLAHNFAAESRISLEIAGSVIGGTSGAVGGVSRPDAVHNSEVRILSRGNVYRNEWTDPCASGLIGWNLAGATGPPLQLAVAALTRNRLDVRSVDDRIEGFPTAILATGSRRSFNEPLQPPPTDNHIELSLVDTHISTPDCRAVGAASNTTGAPQFALERVSDLILSGASVENNALHAGYRNTVRAELRGVTGSGARANRYSHTGARGAQLPAQLRGTGNRLLIVGDLQTFARTNRGIDPPPGTEFFTSAR